MGISKLSAYEIVILLSLNPVTLQCFCNCVALHSEEESRCHREAPLPSGTPLSGDQKKGRGSRWDILCHKYCVNYTDNNGTCQFLLRLQGTLTVGLQART